MQSPFNNIVQHLFHQPSLLSVTVDELERMAQQHPYFAAAHFLLLKKMQVTDHPQFNSQLHKTALYFNNPLWLQFLLQPETVTNFSVSEKAPFLTDEPATATISVQENDVHYNQAPVAETIYQASGPVMNNDATRHYHNNESALEHTDPHYLEASPAPETKGGMMDVITEVFNEPGDEVAQAAAAPAQTGTWTAAPPQDVWEKQEDITTAAAETVGEANTDTATASEIPEAQPDFVAPVQESFIEENSTSSFHADVNALFTESNPTIQEPVAAAVTVAENTPEFVDSSQPEPGTDAQQVNTVAEETPADDHDNTAAPQHVEHSAIIEQKPLLKTIIETAGAKDDLLFEPYHTVDYFASQGIKLSKAEIDAKDKLGRQLKSFTEWLKSMKKLPQVSIDKILSENEESKVVADAIHSIENKEVITEAMAEVYEKQGMTEKAVEVYRKLSLLNPAKSAYFAAKTDLLKN